MMSLELLFLKIKKKFVRGIREFRALNDRSICESIFRSGVAIVLLNSDLLRLSVVYNQPYKLLLSSV